MEDSSQARMRGRLGRRLVVGGFAGAIVGAVIGTFIGVLFFDRSAAVVMSIVGAGLFGLGVGMLIGGYSSLESPDPGAEPSDTARPVADRSEAVREEHPDVPDMPTTGLGTEDNGRPGNQ
jgi:gas vesicle protein